MLLGANLSYAGGGSSSPPSYSSPGYSPKPPRSCWFASSYGGLFGSPKTGGWP